MVANRSSADVALPLLDPAGETLSLLFYGHYSSSESTTLDGVPNVRGKQTSGANAINIHLSVAACLYSFQGCTEKNGGIQNSG